ncbi:hypothetical protein [Nonomuraea basaltis]|uniref:hypothetical protein n=1 Tax=Nonomuraea basaltis TaxID=2495887 RepID=UPI00148685A5|nr:hypothetical protein [Nonomuraea basaltis]
MFRRMGVRSWEQQPASSPAEPTAGREHWVQLKSGDYKDLWVWRTWLQPWSG